MKVNLIQDVYDEKTLEENVQNITSQGYTVLARSSRHAVLHLAGFGDAGVHVALFLLTFYTLGLGNLLYAMLSKSRGHVILVQICELRDS